MVIYNLLYIKLASVFYTFNDNYALNNKSINRVKAESFSSPEEPAKKEPK